MNTISYNVNEHTGILYIYINDMLLAEISDCLNMTDEEVQNLINAVLEEHDIEV